MEGAEQDREDVRLAIEGDVDAFERIYRRHLPRVHRTARWILGTEDVDGALQEVFVRAWQKLPTFEQRAALSTWLNRLASRVLLRHRERVARLRDREVALSVVHERAIAPERPGLRLDLEQAVTELPAGARSVFILHEMQGLSHQEIAETLAIHIATSRSQLHYARRLLRQYLMGGHR